MPQQRPVDVLVLGAGPAGLAAAIEVALRGLRVLVIEKNRTLSDKACGEGVLPEGTKRLDALGVLDRVPPSQRAVLTGATLYYSGSAVVELPFEAPGLGLARATLMRALESRALEEGARIEYGRLATGWFERPDRVDVTTPYGAIAARLVVDARGLSRGESTRFGARRHFAVAPWTNRVEVHFGEDVEAYVTPVGSRQVNVAILWRRGTGSLWDSLLMRFPDLTRKLNGARRDARVLGAGPLRAVPRAVVQGRVVKLGDAAGAVDPIAGEGVSMALLNARAFGELVEVAMERSEALSAYGATVRARWEEAERSSHALMASGRA